MKYLDTTTEISECRAFRYSLRRIWNRDRPPVAFVMLNPSTADGSQDDNTIRRCVGFAADWGWGGIVVVNLFAFRATKPRDLYRAADPIGPLNDEWIARETAGRATVCAWGAGVAPLMTPKRPDRFRNRVAAVMLLLSAEDRAEPRHLGLTEDGHPRHPLFVPKIEPLHSFAGDGPLVCRVPTRPEQEQMAADFPQYVRRLT